MTDINIDGVIEAARKLYWRTNTVGGHMHGPAWIFDKCMRAFDCKVPAEAITFAVHIAAPVNQPGEATIYRDGRLVMRIAR